MVGLRHSCPRLHGQCRGEAPDFMGLYLILANTIRSSGRDDDVASLHTPGCSFGVLVRWA
jgi:hypothetical protein